MCNFLEYKGPLPPSSIRKRTVQLNSFQVEVDRLKDRLSKIREFVLRMWNWTTR